ncbi:hypothetical protein HAX54_041588 [Datura stramonium]|uniref:Pectinesterase inhibitor domain-containing protein n=1 Tax=Datura stramonium TaxID=4076 RepID=A0ABS8SL54_DATST|nr:hypothetical protein [Datura stramonium]
MAAAFGISFASSAIGAQFHRPKFVKPKTFVNQICCAGRLEWTRVPETYENDAAAREEFERRVLEEERASQSSTVRSATICGVVNKTSLNLFPFVMDANWKGSWSFFLTLAQRLSLRLPRLRPRLNKEFFDHLQLELGRHTVSVNKTQEVEDRLIELEALQRALQEATEAYDKLQADLYQQKEELTSEILTSKDVSTVCDSFQILLLYPCWRLLDENIATAHSVNQKQAAEYMEKLRGLVLKYLTCLSAFANTVKQSEKQLAHAALSVSLSRAKSTTIFVSKLTRVRGLKPREKQAVNDCLDTMSDSVDQINKSIPELGRTGQFSAGQDFMWHVSNVQTWVSAALTDENTCLDGFSGPGMNGNVKAALRLRILHLAQVTSNALALVNRFADRHRPQSLNTP